MSIRHKRRPLVAAGVVIAVALVAGVAVYSIKVRQARARAEALGINLDMAQASLEMQDEGNEAAADLSQATQRQETLRVVKAAAARAAEAGDTGAVVDNLVDMLGLASEMADETAKGIHVLIAMEALMDTFDAANALLPERGLDPALRQRLSEATRGMDVRPAIAKVLESQADAWRSAGVEAVQITPALDLRDRRALGAIDTLLYQLRRRVYASPLGEPSRLRSLVDTMERIDRACALSGLPYWEYQDRIADEPRMHADPNDPDPSTARFSLSMMGHGARVESLLRLMRAGLAIEAARDAMGSLPAELSGVLELEPEDTIDPCTGEPFRYFRDGDTFVLYSLGPDQEDDGGRHDVLDGDLVWRAAARP